jgi:hypothetical protein
VAQNLGIEINAPFTNQVVRVRNTPQAYFKIVEVLYEESTLSPRNVQNKVLTLNLTGQGTLTLNFNSTGAGVYTYGASSGSISSYVFGQEPYRARLWPIYFSGLYPMTLRLDFVSTTLGNVRGNYYDGSASPPAVSGTFSLN